MTVKYPRLLNLRLTNDDIAELDRHSQQLDLPRSTLIRHIWREWLVNQSTQKTAS